jgi:hypothetical protein
MCHETSGRMAPVGLQAGGPTQEPFDDGTGSFSASRT